MNISDLETLSRRNANKFRTNLDAIIEKFSQPFDERYHDVIDLKTLTIASDKGQLRSKSYRSKKFGKTKLAVEDCHDLTTYIEDSALGTSHLSTTLYELNTTESKLHDTLTSPTGLSVNHDTSFQNDFLCELGNEEPEPSDAETLSESDSDSWESDDDILDKGGSSISKETSNDAESTPEETQDRSGNSEVDLQVSSEDVVPSIGSIDLYVKELSRSPELYRSAVILRLENEELLKDCELSECDPQFRVIAELNASPEILKQQSDLVLPKPGFIIENYSHLMQDRTRSKYCNVQGEVLCSGSFAINDKITGQDTGVQMHNDSIDIRDREREPGMGVLCEETGQNPDIQMDVSSNGRASCQSSCFDSNKALITEELGDLNHSGAICNMQNRVSCRLCPGLSVANHRDLCNSTFTVETDNSTAQKEKSVLKGDFSVDDGLIRLRCCRSDLQMSGCLTTNLSNRSKSSTSVSVSETMPEICNISCLNSSCSNQTVTPTMVSSKGNSSSLTVFLNQPTEQSIVMLPNRFHDFSASDKPAVTLCVPCYCNASFKTTCSKTSSCMADPLQLPSMRSLRETYKQMKSVVPKLVAPRCLPLVMSELPTCAANRTETDLNDHIKETSTVAENIDQDDFAVPSMYRPTVQMIENSFSNMGNHNLSSGGLTDSIAEQSHSNYASHPHCCKTTDRNCNALSPAFTTLCKQTVVMSAIPKTPKQQIGNAFLNSWRQKAQVNSSNAPVSPSECFAKLKLSSPDVLVTHVDNMQHAVGKSKRDIFQRTVAEINNNSSCISPVSISFHQKRVTVSPNVEELCEKANGVTAMKEVDQWMESTSHADQIVGIKSDWLNKSDVSQGCSSTDVSIQSLNNAEPGIKTELPSADDLSDINSDTDEEDCFISLLSDLEEGKDADVRNNVKQKVVCDDTESEDSSEVTLAGATSTPTKDGSNFIFDASFLSCISDSSEIERIKELAMEIICEEDLEETLIEKAKIRSSVTAEPTEKTNMASVTCVQMTEDNKSLKQFEFLSHSDELQGIDSLAAFRHVARQNRMMARTWLETASGEVMNTNDSVHNATMRKADKKVKVMKTDESRYERNNHQKDKLFKPASIPITKILEIDDNDLIKANLKVSKTNLEMGKINDIVNAVGKTEEKTTELRVGLRHYNSFTMSVSSIDTIQVRKRLAKACALDQTVSPVSTFVSSEAQLEMKLSGNPCPVSVSSTVKATCSTDSQSALVDAVRCLPSGPVSPQPTKRDLGVCQPSEFTSISAPAKLGYSFYMQKMHRKSENDKATSSLVQKATNTQVDLISVVSGSSHKSLLYPRKYEVASHKTTKRSSDDCRLEHVRSTKRSRNSLWESSSNDKKDGP